MIRLEPIRRSTRPTPAIQTWARASMPLRCRRQRASVSSPLPASSRRSRSRHAVSLDRRNGSDPRRRGRGAASPARTRVRRACPPRRQCGRAAGGRARSRPAAARRPATPDPSAGALLPGPRAAACSAVPTHAARSNEGPRAREHERHRSRPACRRDEKPSARGGAGQVRHTIPVSPVRSRPLQQPPSALEGMRLHRRARVGRRSRRDGPARHTDPSGDDRGMDDAAVLESAGTGRQRPSCVLWRELVPGGRPLSVHNVGPIPPWRRVLADRGSLRRTGPTL